MAELGYTGRTRRRWLFWTQYEYLSHAWYGARWQNPWNVDEWPVMSFWTYRKPSEADVICALLKRAASK